MNANRLRILLPLIAASTGLIALSLVVLGFVAAADSRVQTCLANVGDGEVLTSFEMPKAREFWTHFPKAGKAPELETESSAFVVVFSGPTSLVVAAAPPPDGTIGPAVTTAVRDGVVCVVVGDVPTYYSGIDFDGFVP